MRMIAKSVGFLVVLTFAIAASGGENVVFQEKVLPRANPTAFEFNASVSEVTNAVRRSHDEWSHEMSKKYGSKTWDGVGDAVSRRVHTRRLQMIGLESLVWKGDADSLTRGLLTKPGNENDAYLLGMEAPYCESAVYFQDGQPLIYHADFHIHLASVASGRTRVEITTYDPQVAAGVDRRFSPVSSGPGLFTVEVAPTTVEEYQILLGIGRILGTTNMPQLAIPGVDASAKQIVRPFPK